MVVHGDSGVGKSRLSWTAPTPRLLIDAEGGFEWMRTPFRMWDPKGPLPADIGQDETIVIWAKDFADIQLAYQWLQSGQHPFNSVILDSLTEIQKRYIIGKFGANALDQQAWGDVLRDMEQLVLDYKDLKFHPTHPLWAIVFIAGSHEKEGKRRPLLQGQLGLTLPYKVDVLGYLETQLDATGGFCRRLLVQPYGPIDAKDRTDFLTEHYGPVIHDPDIKQMLRVLNQVPQEAPANA